MSETIDINVTKEVEQIDINVTENVIEVNINSVSGGGASWGEIDGTLSSQTDLQNALNSKANESDLGAVAFSNDYNDLDNKPNVPTLESVLLESNITNGNDISISNGDEITFDNGSRIRKGLTDAGNGGAKGVALVCSLDYELKWEAGRQYVMQQDGFTIRETSYNFNITPTTNDDITKGFVVGSRWLLDNGNLYICTVDTENNAFWELIPNDLTDYVPYTGATANVDLGENSLSTPFIDNKSNVDFKNILRLDENGISLNTEDNTTNDSNTLEVLPTSTDSKKIINTPSLQINTNAIETSEVGKLKWNDIDGTLDLGLKGGNVTLQIGQESVIRVVNKTGSNLLESNYQAVRLTGAQGQRLKVGLAQATNDSLSAETIGLVTETINNNQEGFVTTSGLIRSINTTGSLQGETWADGDVLYLSPSVAGRITNVKPTAPNHLVIIGYVVYSHANNGTIFVKVDNGYELEELHNVTTTNYTTPIDTDSVLTFDISNSLWKRFSFSSLKTWLDNYLTASKIRGYLGVTTLSGSNTGDQDLSSLATKSMSAYSMRVNNTNATANATEITFQQTSKGAFTGGITWTGIAAPSGTTSHTYNWQRVGNLVTLNVTLFYQNTGTALTSVVMDFMNDFPTPVKPDGLTNASEVLYNGSGDLRQTATSSVNLLASCLLRSNSANNGFQLIITQASISAKIVKITIQYFTA